MKKQKMLRYLGILLIILPFLGLYQYMKTTIYIVVGIVLIMQSQNKSEKKSSQERASSNMQNTTSQVIKNNTSEFAKVK